MVDLSPLLDEMVDFVSGLSKAEAFCEVLVLLGLGLLDLSVIRL